MPRPRLCRRVWFQPGTTYFKPAGVPMAGLTDIVLTVDELEAIRLKDHEGMEQEEAAKKMNISQPTFHRLVLSARKKVAEALVNGKAIKIEGGNFKMVQQMQPGRGMGMGRGQGAGRGMAGGRGRMGGQFAAGPGGNCVCPKCGYQQAHGRGVPCAQMKCPKCGAQMVRGES